MDERERGHRPRRRERSRVALQKRGRLQREQPGDHHILRIGPQCTRAHGKRDHACESRQARPRTTAREQDVQQTTMPAERRRTPPSPAPTRRPRSAPTERWRAPSRTPTAASPAPATRGLPRPPRTPAGRSRFPGSPRLPQARPPCARTPYRRASPAAARQAPRMRTRRRTGPSPATGPAERLVPTDARSPQPTAPRTTAAPVLQRSGPCAPLRVQPGRPARPRPLVPYALQEHAACLKAPSS